MRKENEDADMSEDQIIELKDTIETQFNRISHNDQSIDFNDCVYLVKKRY